MILFRNLIRIIDRKLSETQVEKAQDMRKVFHQGSILTMFFKVVFRFCSFLQKAKGKTRKTYKSQKQN